jgi:2-isopropylmalate synthase
MEHDELTYDWNTTPGTFDWSTVAPVALDDETLRDGLQSPSAVDPGIDEKIRILHLMDRLGIETADVGLPGAGPRAVEAVRALVREIDNAGLSITPNCAARTVVADIEPIARISHETGVAIEACTFIGSSRIRRYAEGWTLDRILGHAEEAVTFAVGEGLPVMFVTEDTTRAHPDDLRALYGRAVEWGARRICLADTVGHATPEGTYALVRFVIEEIVEPSGREVGVDWHGHRDRGLGLANCLAAIRAGADRIHGSALGVGERSGNPEMDLLLVNLVLLGIREADLTVLPEYCETVARACGIPVGPSYPVVGRDAFRTGTGVHASAIVKAEEMGDAWLADRVYSGVPASLVGRVQEIDVGPMSGLSNVRHWLRRHGHADDEARARRILAAAKDHDRTLTDLELEELAHDPGDTSTGP